MTNVDRGGGIGTEFHAIPGLIWNRERRRTFAENTFSVVKNFTKFSMECIKIKAWDDESFGTDLVD